MRVITGSARGLQLQAPAGLDTRPTSAMAKEAIFSIIQFEVEGASVLDLFAGSGQLGIEALSRGAGQAVFIDSAKEAQAIIRANLETTKLGDNTRLSQANVATFLATATDNYDIAFVDPPYGKGFMEQVLPLVSQVMRDSGVIVCESQREEILPDTAGVFNLKREYRYGKAKITTYRQGEKL